MEAVKRATTSTPQSKDKLLQEGWSVPIKGSVCDLSVADAGVCLASTSNAKKVMSELKGTQPLANLAPANIDNNGQEVHV